MDEIYSGVATVDHYVIMPNHVHLLIGIHSSINDEKCENIPTVSRVINQFKGSVTKKIGFRCWQKSFHDHVVRDDAEYRIIWKYIDKNPGKWEEDRYYVRE